MNLLIIRRRLSAYALNPFLLRAVFAVCFLALAIQPLDDPDFGWHLSIGQYYLDHHAIPPTDIFSWTMPSYPWINHEYAIDAFCAFLYRLSGEHTLPHIFLFAGLSALLFFIILPRLCTSSPSSENRILLGFSAFLVVRPFVGVRPQLFDWLGIALILLIWQHYRSKNVPKALFFLAPVFFVWANVHGGFPLGLAMLAGLMGFHFIETASHIFVNRRASKDTSAIKSLALLYGGIFALTILATLINPYGHHLYTDIANTLGTSPLIYEYISEWKPALFGTVTLIPFFVYVFFFIFLLLSEHDQRSSNLQDAGIVMLSLAAALAVNRFIPFFILLSLPIFYRRFSRHPLFLPVLTSVMFGSFLVSQAALFNAQKPANTLLSERVGGPNRLASTPLTRRYSFYVDEPSGAIAYIKTHPLPTRLFNDYSWGGSIIWHLPGTKVFIDGRMAYWRVGDRNIFNDYLAINNVGSDWHGLIDNYLIQAFLIRRDSSLAAVLKELPERWEKVYEDEQAIIFVEHGANVPVLTQAR